MNDNSSEWYTMIHWHRFLLGISPRSHIDFTCDLIRYLDRRLETRLWLERSAARDSTRLDSRECATCKRVWRSYVGLAGLRPLTGSDSCPAVGRRIVWPSAVRRVHSGCLYGPVAPYGTRIHTRRVLLCAAAGTRLNRTLARRPCVDCPRRVPGRGASSEDPSLPV